MYMIPFSEGEPDGQPRIDPHGCTGSDEKVSAAKIAGDGGCFFLGEVTGTLAGPESRR